MDHQIKRTIDLLKLRFDKEPLKAIETGTIRSLEEETKSTLYISQCLGDRGGLISVDNNEEHINISKEVCVNQFNIDWVKEDSVKFIKEFSDHKFHFAYLDSLNDADHIFEEFKALIPKMVENSMLFIDNSGIESEDETAKKGLKIYKFLIEGNPKWKNLSELSVPWDILMWPHGNRIKINLDKETLEKIKENL